ncbi:hypothetical protein FA95DRAFT_1611318 [Auriscalpium vulgare]|uniref:Uncharacterized protein n=1 Tax=Auriscalpium vulgare TaxID=40419 RepID=A0ACB8RBJ1_9AGAM|nr:hypothetical protein FA95DRAFT_1611318 [Auriscalpium vulgare]
MTPIFVEAAGYMLRPRFCEGWKPLYACWRDLVRGRAAVWPSVIGATRLTDGKQFIIKQVPENSVFEEEVTRLFSEEEYGLDPKLHPARRYT